jgi:hypothetical protein
VLFLRRIRLILRLTTGPVSAIRHRPGRAHSAITRTLVALPFGHADAWHYDLADQPAQRGNKQVDSIPCALMRGGSSDGLFFRAESLPGKAGARDRLLLAAMGSPDLRQIDGMGGGNDLSSKVVTSDRPAVRMRMSSWITATGSSDRHGELPPQGLHDEQSLAPRQRAPGSTAGFGGDNEFPSRPSPRDRNPCPARASRLSGE